MDSIIKNIGALATTDLRKDALSIAEVGYKSIDTKNILYQSVSINDDILTVGENTFTLRSDQKIWIVGAGKCAVSGANALENILGERIAGGVIVDVSDTAHCLPLKKIECYLGTHPKPSEKNIDATKHLVDALKKLNADDIVIALVSGGGSTLLCLPNETSTCLIESDVFDELTNAGASITELNTIRKHLSYARGGWLSRFAYPAKVISLIFSDVPKNDLSIIASGPTVKDMSTIEDAKKIIEKYKIISLKNVTLLETPKDNLYFENTYNTLLVTNDTALNAMANFAESIGYTSKIITNCFSGEASDVAKMVTEELSVSKKGTALFFGGESTVTLGNSFGRGGRNLELAMSALSRIDDNQIIVTFSSDGHDNTDYAGAVCDNITKEHAKEQSVELSRYLNNHESYDFFFQTGDALVTGYTGSNVSDLIIGLTSITE